MGLASTWQRTSTWQASRERPCPELKRTKRNSAREEAKCTGDGWEAAKVRGRFRGGSRCEKGGSAGALSGRVQALQKALEARLAYSNRTVMKCLLRQDNLERRANTWTRQGERARK
eukprot:4347801-Pleurochrysis_carterae.AAC.3